MAIYETVPASKLKSGDEISYDMGTRYVERVIVEDGQITIIWADNRGPEEFEVTLAPHDRVHRVIKSDSESRVLR
jgi:hypothetical protein